MAENQYVVFKLGCEEYGIDIMNVKEIAPYEEVISLPNTPSYIEGVMNYRGNVIPIINLKKRMNIGKFEITKDTRTIVIVVEDKEIGFIVDEASQTIRVDDNQIDNAPFIKDIDKRYIIGIGKLDEERMLVLIDLKSILSNDEIQEIQELGD